jgi:hypothetical protein
LIGIAGPLADVLYSAGTPPVWGLAKNPAPSPRVSAVRIGDRLRVERESTRWIVRDSEGHLGTLRWLPGDDGKPVVSTGVPIRYPLRGVLHVQRLVIDPDGLIKDIGGYVEPG